MAKRIVFNAIEGIFDLTERDHTDLDNIGVNTHDQIDAHIADPTIHQGSDIDGGFANSTYLAIQSADGGNA